MDKNYRAFFGFTKEPFTSDLKTKEILETNALKGVKSRFEYAVRLGALGLVTGETGSGKSTAVRYCTEQLHPSEYRPLYVTATSGSIMEVYRQIASELGIHLSSNSKAVMNRWIKKEISELIRGRKIKVVLIVDEASLLRLEVFAELHTICQFDRDSKPYLPIIFVGQSNLIDKMMYRTSAPLASRIVARSHVEGLDLEEMTGYLEHHLRLSGVKTHLFEQAALEAIHKESGGLQRKTNHLARGALIAAAGDESMVVTAEHVRLASTEIF